MSSIATEAANSSAEAKPTPIRSPRERIVAVVGLGYVGLPTALALFKRGEGVLGFDVDETRLARIQNEDVDLANHDRANLRLALQDRRFLLTSREEDLEFADAVIVAVPTPVDANLVPDLTFIRSACATVVRHARPGQVIVLTSTSYVGSTADLLARPLEERGWKLGRDVFVAFSPERINPGEQAVPQGDVPRVVGGVTEECGRRAAEVLAGTAAFLHHVSSPEAAELTKLHENTFRAVNIALANEVADISRAFGLDVMEVIAAAATKPYGFVPFYPGPGVGGHCIPCDPHYLLWQLRSGHTSAPLVSRARESIAARPFVV